MSYHGELDLQRRYRLFGCYVDGPAVALVSAPLATIEHDAGSECLGSSREWGVSGGLVTNVAVPRFALALRFDLRHGLI